MGEGPEIGIQAVSFRQLLQFLLFSVLADTTNQTAFVYTHILTEVYIYFYAKRTFVNVTRTFDGLLNRKGNAFLNYFFGPENNLQANILFSREGTH